jgi:protein-S-isoprenylcysteine O-methyltransferase Ste14
MSPDLTLYFIWFVWAVSWLGAAFWSTPAAKRTPISGQLVYRGIVFVGFLLLFGIYSPRHMAMTQLWRLNEAWLWRLDLIVVLGFALTWWARLHMGKMWSANITRKADHQVIDSGPYAWMRHPIYTGIIIAAFATATLFGTALAMAGAIAISFGWYLKARQEEEFLRAELGRDSYDGYADDTAMFIPFLKF